MAGELQCVVLAGGLATRMHPLTDDLPKTLLPVAGVPFAHHQLTWLASEGVRRVVLCIGHLGHLIRDYVGTGLRWGIEVQYVDEGDQLRGTGGALRLALDTGCLDESFLVTYGDSFLPVEVGPIWRSFVGSSALVMMTVFRNEGRWERSNVLYEQGKVLYDKATGSPMAGRMKHVDFGLLCMSRAAIEANIGLGDIVDLSDVLHLLSVAGEVAGHEVWTRFFEIGSPEGLRSLEAHLTGRA